MFIGGDFKELQRIYKEHLSKNEILLPRIIHVETRSKCNGLCSFCAASALFDKRKDQYMPFSLIKKIIDELYSLDYPNRLSFYNNNEPFLDERISDIIRLARKKLPKTYLELKSNGKSLTTNKIIEIFDAGLDVLYINDYSDGKKFSKNVQKIISDLSKIRRFKGHLEGDKYFSRIQINLRNSKAVHGTRAGSSPNKKYRGEYIKKVCYRPFEMMVINPEGEVSACSNDFYYAISMGNIKNQALLDMWRSDKWNNLRERLIIGDRSCTSACSKCDYIGFTNEMFKENGLKWRHLDITYQKIIIKMYNLLKRKN